MLITKAGCAGRIGSLLISAEIPPIPRPKEEFCRHKRGEKCLVCVDRCQSGALSSNGFDKEKCFMGIITSIFGATFTAYLGYLNIFAEALLVTMGISLLFDLNIFNVFGNFSSLANAKREGLLGGFLLGISLGIVWLPCVGPVLGSILTMVAVSGKVVYGGLMLFIYSLGFSVPMLLVAYSASCSFIRLQKVSKYSFSLKKVAGFVILGVGFYMEANR